MSNPLISLFGSSVVLWIVLMWIVAVTVGVAWPLMAWSVTRNVRKIARQLERLNDSLESQGSGARSGTLKL